MEVALGALPFRERRRRGKKIQDNDEPDFSKPATSGLEYLRRVQREAALCPDVVIAKDLLPKLNENAQNSPQVKTILTPAPAEFIPSLEWQFQQASCFAELRQRLNYFKSVERTPSHESPELPKIKNEDYWCRFCLGEKCQNEVRKQRNGNKQKEVEKSLPEERIESEHMDEGRDPLLSILMKMGQCDISTVLEYHLAWLQVLGFSEKQGKWMYALLACLEKPLPPNVSSLLRSLARSCADLRAFLDDKNDARLAALNLIITLVTRYFDQTDLAENS